MSQYSSSSAPLDNYHWPTVSPNALLVTDLPAFKHVLKHFNDNPTRTQPPADDAWREKHDRAKVFRDLRDGSLDHRKREAYFAHWGLSEGQVVTSLDLIHFELNVEAATVLAELLRDGSLADLAVLRVGRSALWEMLNEEEPVDDEEDQFMVGVASSTVAQEAYVTTVKLCDALMLHTTLRDVTIAGVFLPIRTLRGSAEGMLELDLSDQHLQTVHGLCVAAGLRINHVLTSLDLRFNPGLGAAAYSSLAEAFSNGAALSLTTLNGIIIDARSTALNLTGRGDVPYYELLWIERRLASVDRKGLIEELNFENCGLGVEEVKVVATMVPSLASTIRLIDLSHNNVCGIHRDRYDTWHGVEESSGLEAFLAALAGRDLMQLKLNSCALGTSGAMALAAALRGSTSSDSKGPIQLSSLEVRSGHMEVDGLAGVLAAVGTDPSANEVQERGLSTMGSSGEVAGGLSLEQTSMDLTQPSMSMSFAASAVASDAPPLVQPSPCCPMTCLDTRGNVVNKLAEARLSTLMERVFEAGWLECFNGIDFRPFAHLRKAPTSTAAGEEWWRTGQAAQEAEAAAILHHTHPNESMRMVSASGRSIVAAPVEEKGLLEEPPPSLARALTPVREEAPLASMLTTKTARGGVLFTLKPIATGSKTKGELNLANHMWVEDSVPPHHNGKETRSSVRFASSYAKERVTGGVTHLGLSIHETCFSCCMALRLRLTKLVLADTRLVGLTEDGAGLLDAAASDRALALQPLKAVCALMRDSAYLRNLDLSGNGLGGAGDAAMEMLAQALSMSVSLKALALARNRFGPQQLGHLTSALIHNNCLESLDLHTNQLGAYNAIQTLPSPSPAISDESLGLPELNRQTDSHGKGKRRRRPLPRVRSKLNGTMQAPLGNALGGSGSYGTLGRGQTTGFSSSGSVHSVRSAYSQKSLSSDSQSMNSTRRSVGDGTLASEPLDSGTRAVSATLARFMTILVETNSSLTRLDLRENGWSVDEKELFADALDIQRDPPFTYLRL